MSLTDAEAALAKTGMKKTSKNGESAQSWVKDHLGHLITRKATKTLKFNFAS